LNPQPNSVLVKICATLVTGCGIGLVRKAPGTFGSLPGLALGGILSTQVSSLWLRAGILLAICAVFIFAIAVVEQAWDTHDDQRIVCDEIAGQAVAVAFLPFSWPLLALGFVLFRIFDIWKPGPVGWADESLPGAWGTFLDDIIAGVFAGLILWAVLALGLLPGGQTF
jgi:phosphatidylglycerophosphatase A